MTLTNLPAAVTLCEEFAHLLSERGHRAGARTKAWVEPMEAMLRLDGRQPDEIRRVISWLDAAGDPVARFWRPNILSPAKLREKWCQMAEQYQASRTRIPGHTPALAGVTADDLARRLARVAT